MAYQSHGDIPHLLEHQSDVDTPDTVWTEDITYVWTGTRWSYLAIVLKLFARTPVCWALSEVQVTG